MKINELVDALRALPAEQQQMVRHLLDLWLNNPGKTFTQEEEIEHMLLADGIVSEVPPPITDPTRFQNWKPVKVEGKPVSETVIEERR
jgi:hypothetical protein